ncbi:uncharacterized protein LDX57_007702 [Aspergillus melleus]|uniref:uncharacterized protein n=1 Tax=Aspergillus melleus TaxID=138277 RepID=UPI001E8DEA5C|nr:uncharacterized protein LDX57_007702 [Aspergillus melleus]KAH8430031.1 hypothetical protein LDX57_007702 [Aspergillus melleus]
MDGVWDPIRVCTISNPENTTTCCGKTRTGTRCKNRISRDSRSKAAHLLQLLVQRPPDDNLVQTLSKIAWLLLCKRYHQSQEDEQVKPLVEHWCDSARDSGVELQYPVATSDLTSTPLTPMEVDPPSAEPQSIHIEQLRQRPGQFEVMSSSQRRIKFGTVNADNTRTPVILRSLEPKDDSGRIMCNICWQESADEIANLKCEHCENSVHLGCMGDWLEKRSTQINFNCPICRGVRRFDAFYSFAVTTREPEDGINGVDDSVTSPGEITSAEGARAQGLRRSGRSRRRPDYYG